MPRQKASEQARKTKRIGVAVTPSEHEAIVKVAQADGLRDHSLILRRRSVESCVREYRRLQAVFAGSGKTSGKGAA